MPNLSKCAWQNRIENEKLAAAETSPWVWKCDEVTGRSDSQTTLQQLERANLFLIPLDQERNWYRYHHLFADLLRIKLGQTHPGLTAELQRCASNWYAAQGRRLEALHYALGGGDIPMAERLLAGNIFLLFDHEDLGQPFKNWRPSPLHWSVANPG